MKLTNQQILENGTHNCNLGGESDQWSCPYVAKPAS